MDDEKLSISEEDLNKKIQGYKCVLNSKAAEESMVKKRGLFSIPCTINSEIICFFSFNFTGRFCKMGTNTWPVQLWTSMETIPKDWGFTAQLRLLH